MKSKVPFLNVEKGDFFLIKEVIFTTDTTYSSLREQFPTH